MLYPCPGISGTGVQNLITEFSRYGYESHIELATEVPGTGMNVLQN